MAAVAWISARFKDFSGEYSIMRIPVNDLEVLQTWQTAVDYASDFAAAVAGAYLGVLQSISFTQNNLITEDNSNPVSGEAQREKGLRFFVHDSVTGDKSHVTLPTADWGTYAEPGTDLVDLAHAEIAPIVTFLEANMEINQGNSVIVDRAVLVGRNN